LHKIVRWWGKSKRAGGDQWWGRWCCIQLLTLSFHFLAGITLHHDDADKLVQVSNGHVRKTARDISNSSWYTTHGLSSHHFLNQFGVQWEKTLGARLIGIQQSYSRLWPSYQSFNFQLYSFIVQLSTESFQMRIATDIPISLFNPSHTTKDSHNTRNFIPYSSQIVCGFFNIPHWAYKHGIFVRWGLWFIHLIQEDLKV